MEHDEPGEESPRRGWTAAALCGAVLASFALRALPLWGDVFAADGIGRSQLIAHNAARWPAGPAGGRRRLLRLHP